MATGGSALVAGLFALDPVIALLRTGGGRFVVVSCVATAHVVDRRIEIRLGVFDEARTELVAERASTDFYSLAFRQVAELERAVGNADQAINLEAESAEDVLDFAVLAFAKTHGDPDVGALHLVERCLDRAIEHAIGGDAFFQLVERILVDLAVGADAVATQPAGGRQFQHAGKAAVVGQQQQAFGVDVEAADRHDARQVVRQVVEYGIAAFRIGIGGHQAGRLVVEPQTGALDTTDRHAIDLDLVRQGDVDDRAVELHAVQLDAAFHDHPLDIAAGGDADACHHLGDTLGVIRDIRLGQLRRRGFCSVGVFALRHRLITKKGLGPRPLGLVIECHLMFA